jgi:hypothetical protein
VINFVNFSFSLFTPPPLGDFHPPRTAEMEVGGAEVSMDISVDDFLVGGVTMFDAHTGRGLDGEFFYETMV